MKFSCPVILLCIALVAQGADLHTNETRYYTLYTDLAPDDAREAGMRMTKMADEYIARTRDFAGSFRRRMPFYLYKDSEDYYATGAPRRSAGYFNGKELVAMAGKLDARTWHVVQHEGFHQFAHEVIRGDLPPWVNEGLAEYFGEGMFTGDGFMSGLVPQWRLKRIRQTFADGKFRPLNKMMVLTAAQWNADLDIVNYDQAWSMAHFLAHGENGRYQRAFGQFMVLLGQGRQWPTAWAQTFGDTKGFEQRWRDYWTKLPDEPTADLYAQANVATLTSFLARAASQRQTFDTFDSFMQSASHKQLKSHPDDWLPPSLLEDNLLIAQTMIKERKYDYTLVGGPGQRMPTLMCTLPDGRRVVGSFTVRNDHVGSVTADVSKSRTP